ncbi:MAG: transposase [Clostridia bacterium]|nr:transposase [Clostridia bacterium]
MAQQSFSSLEYENRKTSTKRDEMLAFFDKLIPWDEWIIVVKPFYYTGRRGRKPVALEIMIRVYVLQQIFGLSSEAIEDCVYDSFAMRNFLNIDFFSENVPDATTIQRFRRLLSKNEIDKRFDKDLAMLLAEKNYKLKNGSAVEPRLLKIKRKPRKKKTDK